MKTFIISDRKIITLALALLVAVLAVSCASAPGPGRPVKDERAPGRAPHDLPGYSAFVAEISRELLNTAEELFRQLEDKSLELPLEAALVLEVLERRAYEIQLRIGRELRRPDLSPLERRALEASSDLVGGLGDLLAALRQMIQGDDRPEVREVFLEALQSSREALKRLENSGDPGYWTRPKSMGVRVSL